MKIIEHGNTYREIQCPKCKAHIGYTNKEVQTHYGQSPFGDDWSNEKYIECPECEEHITLFLSINDKVEENGNNIFRYYVSENTARGLY